MERDCDGVIVMSNALTEADALELSRRQPHLVVLNSTYPALAEHCFMADHVRGGRVAGEALLSLGHRQLALIGGPSRAPDNVDRLAGFALAIAEAGIDAAGLPQAQADFSTAGGYAAAGRLLDAGHRFTALFCANDEMAIGALACLAERGLKVPADVSVLGYDDTGKNRGNALKGIIPLAAFDDDANALIQSLQNHPECNGRIGAAGICLGGHLAFRAALVPGVLATACFYPTGKISGLPLPSAKKILEINHSSAAKLRVDLSNAIALEFSDENPFLEAMDNNNEKKLLPDADVIQDE
jgi:LacI family transcriptional regulator